MISNRGRRCSLSLFRQNRLGEGYSEIKPPSPRSEVGSGPIAQTVKLKSQLITETKEKRLYAPAGAKKEGEGEGYYEKIQKIKKLAEL